MNDIPVSDTRNFVILGHTGSGKTTLVDALLLKLGLNDRLGSVSAKSSVADYTDEEKARQITIFAKPFNATYKSGGKSYSVIFTDTPGYMDFQGQVIAACKGADAALVAVDATAGIQVGTRRVHKVAQRQGLARAFIVTGLDKENANFWKIVEDIKAAFGAQCVPVVLPKPDKSGVVDVLAAKELEGDLAAQVSDAKTKLVELAAETDDALLEKYLGGEELKPEEIAKGLVDAVAKGGLIPIFACMAQKDTGLTELLDGIVRLLPSPERHQITDADGKPIAVGANDPFVGFVWRTVNDPFIGQVTFTRVIGGTLKSDSELHNATKNQKERLTSLLVVNGKKQTAITKATAGDIVAIPKLKATTMGDTLCAQGTKVVCAKMSFPSPVIYQCVSAKTQADEDKLGPALGRITDDDPTLKVERNTETKETLIAGLGDVHIDVAVQMMKNRSHVELLLSTPKVPYRETVTSLGEGHYKHKKQSGGRGQYGEVYLKIQPKKHGDDEWFVDAVVGGVIPHNFIPAVEKGVAEGMLAGAIAGYPVQDVKVSVYDGSYHDVDSSEIAFKIASSRAFREGMSAAKPVLLEPIMKVRVLIPDHFMGDINGDLNHRRGRILGLEVEDGMQCVVAEVPQAELFRYAAELRSMTGGQGTFEMEFSRYDVVPSNVAQKVIAAAAANKKKEEEDLSRMVPFLSKCELCPRRCGVDRNAGELGYCKAGAGVEVFRYGAHQGEEPPVSGTKGSGTIFFSRCTLRCVYCQNYPWSQEGQGLKVDAGDLTRMFESLRADGCHNWNLVSPTPWLPMIRQAIENARRSGKSLPVVYNTSGFERTETLDEFRDVADIYLTDLRYAEEGSAAEGSGFDGYVGAARAALKKMWKLSGPLKCDENGVAVSGTICRILVLPGRAGEAVDNLAWIAENIGAGISLSLMAQYLPLYKAGSLELWNRRISAEEYSTVCEAAEELGFSEGWTQEYEGVTPGELIGHEMKGLLK